MQYRRRLPRTMNEILVERVEIKHQHETLCMDIR
jgi:hypothetical protein